VREEGMGWGERGWEGHRIGGRGSEKRIIDRADSDGLDAKDVSAI
jgi:hypothetical protein